MAYTRIHAIKATVNRSIAYICNPEKTEGELYVSSYGCAPKTAHLEFAFANGKNPGKDSILAHHLIQSFSPGEVTFETAHQIGIELADKLLEGKYSYVIATHVEKDHVHNHIIFCATDNIDHKKYNTCKRNYYKIRKLSDELCSEHHLSVIIPGQQRGKSYEEWEANQNGKSWKDKIRRDIDATIKLSNSYDDFLRLIRLKGYEIKGEQPDDSLKYIAFRSAGKDRFVRGSAKSLGSAYTREMIRERIETRDQKRNAYKQREYSTRKLIDTRQQQFEESPGLKHWADIENLKIAASTYANAGSITELKAKITEQQELSKAARSELVELEREMKSASEILKYAQQYVANKPYHTRSKKSNNPDAYFRSHESQLLLYDGAKNMLRSAGIDLKSINLEQMLSDYRVLEEKHKELQKTYRTANAQLQKMEQSLQKITQYFEKEGAVTEKDVNQRNNRTL